jgi:hypothetical protein
VAGVVAEVIRSVIAARTYFPFRSLYRLIDYLRSPSLNSQEIMRQANPDTGAKSRLVHGLPAESGSQSGSLLNQTSAHLTTPLPVCVGEISQKGFVRLGREDLASLSLQ